MKSSSLFFEKLWCCLQNVKLVTNHLWGPLVSGEGQCVPSESNNSKNISILSPILATVKEDVLAVALDPISQRGRPILF